MFYYKPGRFFDFGMNNGMLSNKNYELILILELSVILYSKIYNTPRHTAIFRKENKPNKKNDNYYSLQGLNQFIP